MDIIISIREKIQEIYADHTLILTKSLQFVMSLFIFFVINKNVGYLEVASSMMVTVALAVICTFLPLNMTMFVAIGLVLAHVYAVSFGFLIATALLFFVMVVFYFRLTPDLSLFAVLTPIACVLHIPFAVTMAVALIYNPLSAVAVGCGIVSYYIIEYIKVNASLVMGEGAPGIMEQMSAFVQEVLTNKEMWVIILAMIIASLVIFTIRKQSFTQAWKIAIAVGTIVHVLVIIAGDVALEIDSSYVDLLCGSVAAVIIGLILEIFYFAVDYSRTEKIQYEDDDYYYYVKAVPKLKVGKKEKSVKQIYSHSEEENNKEQVEHITAKAKGTVIDKNDSPRNRRKSKVKAHTEEEVERELLKRSMREL